MLASSAALVFAALAASVEPAPVAGEPESVVVSVRPDPRGSFDQASAIAIVDEETVRRSAPAVLPDLLRDQPGVFMQQTGPGQGAPIVRGLIGSAVLMLVDGVRLNSAFFRPAPNQFFSLVDPYNVQRIEVLRGPGSSLHGSDAMGGAIAVFTPTPRFSGESWQVAARALGQVASADRSWVSRVSLSGGRQGIAATGGVTIQRRDDLRPGGGGRLSPSGYDSYAANGKLAFHGGADEAVLGVQYLVEPKTPRYDELVPGFGRTAAPNELFLFEPMRRLAVHGHYRRSSEHAVARSVEVRLSFQRLDDDRRVRDLGGPIETRERNRSDAIAGGVEGVARLGARNLFTYGAELSFDRVTSQRLDRDVASGTTTPGVARFADGARMAGAGVYVQDELEAHPRLILTPGVRLSAFDLDIPPADRDLGAQLRFADVTGGLGVLVKIRPELNAVANAGRGFRAPNVFDLSTLGNRPGNRFQIPNPSLAPESALGVDAGLKLALPRLSGEVFGYYSVYRDKIEAIPTGASTPEGRQIVQSQNVSRVDLIGAEATLEVRPSPRWEIWASGSYTHGRERLSSGMISPAERIPPLHGRLGALFRPREWLWLEAFVRAAARQGRLAERDLGDPRINPDGTPAWTTVNVRVGGTFGRHLRGRLAFENALDARYREHGSGIDAAGLSLSALLEAEI